MKKLLLATAISAVVFTGQASAAVGIPTISVDGGNPRVNFSATDGVNSASIVPLINNIYFSGSSAAGGFLESAIKAAAAPSSKVFKYYDAGKAATTYYFTARNDTVIDGFVKDQNYAVHKRDEGGSVWGILAVTPNPKNLALVEFNATAPNVDKSLGKDALLYPCGAFTPSTSGGGIVTCTPTADNKALRAKLVVSPKTAKVIGISDVDAAVFASPLNGANKVNLLSTLAPKVPSTAIAVQTFGVAVNLKLRNAMQKAMIASGALPSSCSVGSEIEACMANFTLADLTALFSEGRLNTWEYLRFGGAANDDLVNVQAAGDRPGNANVHICSRNAGSGTLAAAQLAFENAPCSGALGETFQSPATLSPISSENVSGGMKSYYGNNSSSDVENCLSTMDGYDEVAKTYPASMPSNYNFIAPTLVNGGSFRWAVGILNSERNSTNLLPYRFVKIDGFSSSAKNVAQGKYKFWTELSIVGPVPTMGAGFGLIKIMKDPAIIAKANKTPTNLGATTGYLGTAENATYDSAIAPGTLVNAAFDPLRPVSPFTHADKTNKVGTVNHCRVANVLISKPAVPGLN